jgi:hypothetical protein
MREQKILDKLNGLRSKLWNVKNAKLSKRVNTLKLQGMEQEVKDFTEYYEYIKLRNSQEEKSCYCGHTFECDCGNSSFEEFIHNKNAKK